MSKQFALKFEIFMRFQGKMTKLQKIKLLVRKFSIFEKITTLRFTQMRVLRINNWSVQSIPIGVP